MPISAISQTISTIPEAGRRGVDVRTVFVTKQEDFQDHLQGTTVTELNALKSQINTTVTGMNDAVTNVNTKASEADADALSANNSASIATTKAGEASTSASQALASKNKAAQWADADYNVEVEAGKYSAKHWATVAQSVDVSNKVNTDMSGYTDKATPVDADLIPLSDSAASFGIKKLSWANLKATVLNALNGLTAKTTPVNADIIHIGDSASSYNGKKLTFANLKAMIFTNSALTGNPTAPTQTAEDNSTKLATTEYVDRKFTRGTAVATTSGTAIDFTGIPSWVKRITVLFNQVGINNNDKILLRVGSGSIVTTGYTSACSALYSAGDGVGNNITTNTTGFLFDSEGAFALSGSVEIFNLSGNIYVSNGCIGSVSGSVTSANLLQTGTITLSGALDRIRLTTVSGTAVFDSGSINIMYEG